MADTLRQQALSALAVLHHTSHRDKADVLTAYIAGLEVRSNIALDRANCLIGRGWRIAQEQSSKSTLGFVHPRSFYWVHLENNGDAEFWLKRVRQPHLIEALDGAAFAHYVEAIAVREQSKIGLVRHFFKTATIAVSILIVAVSIHIAKNGGF